MGLFGNCKIRQYMSAHGCGALCFSMSKLMFSECVLNSVCLEACSEMCVTSCFDLLHSGMMASESCVSDRAAISNLVNGR